MEATIEQWEENEEVDVGLRGRPPRQNSNTNITTTNSGDVVYSSQSSAESLSAEEEEEEGKGRPKNGFHMVSNKSGGTESSYGISGFNSGHVDSTSKNFFGNEIVASEVESLSFRKSVETNPQDEGSMKLKDEELPGFGSSSSKQSIEQSGHNTSVENGKAEHGRVKLRDISEQEVSELYLEKVYEKPAAHEFYCPNCNACITKVLIRDRESETRPQTVPLPDPDDPVICTSCFSFLIPGGIWFRPKPVPTDGENPIEPGPNTEDNAGASVPSNSNGTVRDKNSQIASVGKGSLPVQSVGATKPYESNLDSRVGVQLPVPPQDSSQAEPVDKSPEPYPEGRLGVVLPVASVDDINETLSDQKSPMAAEPVVVSDATSIAKAPVPGQLVEASINGVQVPVPSHDSSGTLHDQKSPLPGQSVVSITVTTQSQAPEIDDAGPTETKPRESTTVIITSEGPPIISDPRDAKTFEILKSTVYGGLAEAIASVSIVTSAASAGTATSNILALALANLLGGLFIIGHNLWELKVDQSRVTSNETNEEVDRYQEVLGKKENFFLHAPVAILSFLIFGLVPPLVYGFSFRQSNDRDLKLAAVAASSLICIILLAIGKAYIQNPPKYIKTVLYYVVIGVGAAGISYLAGDLIDILIEKLGWFNSTVAGTLPLPQMSIVKPAWKSW